MSIRPDNLNLDKLLQGRLFRIPDYQRAYSWETKQRRDLFGDIEKLAKHSNSERHHFMSTVVCLQTKEKKEVGADEFGVFHVVDGQQRLTTLIILLKALAKALITGDDIARKESIKLNELLVKEKDGRLILLQTNHDSKRLFRNYLEKGEIPNEANVETLADRNMIKAFNECEFFVKEWGSEVLSLLKLVKNRLDFIFYVLEDEGSVHTIFEVLNSRGLEVDWLDKCKSILMGIAVEKLPSASQDYIREMHEYWSKIYRTIGLKKIQGQEILRFAATLEDSNERNKISSAEDAMEFFRKRCEEDPKLVTDVSDKFLRIAEKLDYFVTNSRLNAVTKISHTRLLAVSIMLSKALDESRKLLIIKEWEKVTFRIFGLYRKDARTKVGEYVRLSREIFKAKNISSTEIVEKITALGQDYPASGIGKELGDTNCYEGWEDELVYFLYRYEENLTRTYGGSISDEVWVQVWNSSPTKTIEHIHPQKLNEHWRGKLGIKTDYVERQAQRLGNLILLPPGVNSSASDKSFKYKKEIYEKHRHLKIIDEVIAKDDWNIDSLKEREDKLIAWAQKEWE
ncbi:MAG: DUF262 domain-containing protein [Gloeotrichia echinulata GP01]